MFSFQKTLELHKSKSDGKTLEKEDRKKPKKSNTNLKQKTNDFLFEFDTPCFSKEDNELLLKTEKSWEQMYEGIIHLGNKMSEYLNNMKGREEINLKEREEVNRLMRELEAERNDKSRLL